MKIPHIEKKNALVNVGVIATLYALIVL